MRDCLSLTRASRCYRLYVISGDHWIRTIEGAVPEPIEVMLSEEEGLAAVISIYYLITQTKQTSPDLIVESYVFSTYSLFSNRPLSSIYNTILKVYGIKSYHTMERRNGKAGYQSWNDNDLAANSPTFPGKLHSNTVRLYTSVMNKQLTITKKDVVWAYYVVQS